MKILKIVIISLFLIVFLYLVYKYLYKNEKNKGIFDRSGNDTFNKAGNDLKLPSSVNPLIFNKVSGLLSLINSRQAETDKINEELQSSLTLEKEYQRQIDYHLFNNDQSDANIVSATMLVPQKTITGNLKSKFDSSDKSLNNLINELKAFKLSDEEKIYLSIKIDNFKKYIN